MKTIKNRIYIVNGPNLNRLGRRDTTIYGQSCMEEFIENLRDRHAKLEILPFQSNAEGAIIDKLQEAADDPKTLGVVINPGAYAHYSYAIADALADLRHEGISAIEVHISNIAAREDFRHNSVTAPNCIGYISGLGLAGYSLAIDYLSKW